MLVAGRSQFLPRTFAILVAMEICLKLFFKNMSRTITYVSDSGYSYLDATIKSGAVEVKQTRISDSFPLFEGTMSIPEFTRFLVSKGSLQDDINQDWMEVSEVQVELGESWPPEGFEEDMKEMIIYERYTPSGVVN